MGGANKHYGEFTLGKDWQLYTLLLESCIMCSYFISTILTLLGGLFKKHQKFWRSSLQLCWISTSVPLNIFNIQRRMVVWWDWGSQDLSRVVLGRGVQAISSILPLPALPRVLLPVTCPTCQLLISGIATRSVIQIYQPQLCINHGYKERMFAGTKILDQVISLLISILFRQCFQLYVGCNTIDLIRWCFYFKDKVPGVPGLPFS